MCVCKHMKSFYAYDHACLCSCCTKNVFYFNGDSFVFLFKGSKKILALHL